MTKTWEEHQKLLTELDRQRIGREAREARERQEAEEAPLREQALELAKAPVDLSRYRNERNLMLFPFCSTAKAKRVKGIRYVSADGKRWLEVTANYDYGMAKIWDFDILRFALSKAGEIALHVGYFPNSVEFSGYECLKALNRSDQGKNYRWFRDAINRLCLTGYRGNIFRENEKITEVFTLIQASYEDETGKMERVKFVFNERIVESVKFFKGLLSINRDVINEEAGIKKRLLELIAVSKGKDSSWTISLEKLQALCAHEGTLKEFKRQLKEYWLPWEVRFNKSFGGGQNITFSDK
ncbi:MAG: replication initiator protein A [Ignavibacteriae bacterium]|nr:replication initiator protein A [Ignavibacteriota bacterium]